MRTEPLGLERLGTIIDDTLACTAFLSRLPAWRLRGGGKASALPDFQRTAHGFALAGAIIAMPAACVLALAQGAGLPALICALAAMAALVMTTGALHEDGLADVADGFWGGANVARKLAIMRDSAIGTYGVLALVATFALRAACLAAILAAHSVFESVVILLAVASLSRAAMVWPWAALPAVRPSEAGAGTDAGGKDESGLSARYGEPDAQTASWAAVFCLPALLTLAAAVGLVSTITALLLSLLAIAALMLLARRHIGGHTGDVLGAAQQMSEMGLYIGLLIAI